MAERKKHFDVERLSAVKGRLTAQLETLDSVLGAMQTGDVGKIPVDGARMLTRGLRSVDGFLDHARRSAREALEN